MNNASTRRIAIASLLAAFGAAPAIGQVIYDSTVSPQPGNLPSVGAEAYAFKEFGDGVMFVGTARSPKSATVTMSSWACQAGNWFSADCVTTPGATSTIPVTLKIYAAGNPAPGALLASVTQSFAIPYRPSSDNVNCTGGRWRQSSTGTCFNGLAANITFDLSALSLVLPNKVVFGISYNTSHYGPAPIGEAVACYATTAGCFYDSLNIGLAPVVSVGTQTYPDTVYQNSNVGAEYCDLGTAGTGTFRLDSPTNQCWTGYIPAVQFTAYTLATTNNACKNGGWQSLARAGGSIFKNQGDCIQYVNTGK